MPSTDSVDTLDTLLAPFAPPTSAPGSVPEPPQERLRSVDEARSIFRTLLKADEASALNRARVDGMFDGAAPFDQAKLIASGQAQKTNLNFGEAQRYLDLALSSYVDLNTSLEALVEVTGTLGTPQERGDYQKVVGEELTAMVREWPEYHGNYLRLVTTFVKHGVGIAYFDNPTDWRFQVGGFNDVLIPRQTPATENALTIACIRREYPLHELYGYIRNEAAAAKRGWRVPAVKQALAHLSRTTGRRQTGSMSSLEDYEAFAAEIKNNDLYVGLQNPSVAVVHALVQEVATGKISHYIYTQDACCESGAKDDFLFVGRNRFDSVEQALIFFTYGVGTNGTYHSIRGLGHRIFAHVQTSNRLRCQLIDGAMLSATPMIQPENQRAMDELQFTNYGGFTVLSSEVNFIERAIPNLSNAVVPALTDLDRQLQLNTDTYHMYGDAKGSPYRSQAQFMAEMDISTRVSSTNINLFYGAWTRLWRELVRRVVRSGAKDSAVREFYRRCEARGVPKEFIDSLDLARTRAVRSVGNGSAAARLAAQRELLPLAGAFDEEGRHNLYRDIVATRVGFDLANRYVPAKPETRVSGEYKIAILENNDLSSGTPVPVISSEYHGEHLQAHLPALMQMIEQINLGQVDPMQALGVLQALYDHIGQHAQYAAADPALAGIAAQARQALQFGDEVINNTRKALEKIQREGGGAAEPGQPDPAQQAEELRLRNKQREAELDFQIREAKFRQEMAHKDAEFALKMQQQAPSPAIL